MTTWAKQKKMEREHRIWDNAFHLYESQAAQRIETWEIKDDVH